MGQAVSQQHLRPAGRRPAVSSPRAQHAPLRLPPFWHLGGPHARQLAAQPLAAAGEVAGGDAAGSRHSRFEAAAEEAKALPASTTNDDKLQLYALFKQATVGDNSTARPGMLDAKGRAKWGAWDRLKGKGREAAEEEYVSKVAQLRAKAS